MSDAAEDIAREGYALLRGAIPPDLLAQAQAAFDAGYLPSSEWPVPRQAEWRHSQVDLDPAIMAIARLPDLLAAVEALVGAPFFLMQVEGREPVRGNQRQPLHRDAAGSDFPMVSAFIYLDDYGPDNGATQLVPATHNGVDDGEAMILQGRAGDIAVIDANLLHGATTNRAGTRRRTLLATYADARMRDDLVPTEALRGVRMDTSEVFGADSAARGLAIAAPSP